jgi:hypothetical protein
MGIHAATRLVVAAMQLLVQLLVLVLIFGFGKSSERSTDGLELAPAHTDAASATSSPTNRSPP